MSQSLNDLDAIFNGTASVINTAQNVCGAVIGGINDIKNVVDNSRRNAPPAPQMSYVQPVTYEYGYADYGTGYNPYGYSNFPGTYNTNMMAMSPNGQVGYPGFSNPMYGMTSPGPTMSINMGGII